MSGAGVEPCPVSMVPSQVAGSDQAATALSSWAA